MLTGDLLKALERECHYAHNPMGFDPRNPIVRLHEPTFSTAEIEAALDCLISRQVTMGEKVRQFERSFADYVGAKHAVMVNSGSSANLLAVAALANPAYGTLPPGSEVIVPALSWSTTVWPIVQMGLVPVIVDIDPQTLNISPSAIERAITNKTSGIMLVHVYGNPCDMIAIDQICRVHNIALIEDCCEALGTTYAGEHVGIFGSVGTFSFYYSHHITTLEGGMVVTDDDALAELLRILRAHGWVRETEHPETWTDRHPDIDPRFLFVNMGYNLRPTELQGAMGLVQLPKLDWFVQQRRQSAAFFANELSKIAGFEFQKEERSGRSSSFGLAIGWKREEVKKIRDLLAAANIEGRPIICGNIARQPGIRMWPHRVSGDLDHADAVMNSWFSIGCHQGLDDGARRYVVDTFRKIME